MKCFRKCVCIMCMPGIDNKELIFIFKNTA